MAEGKTMRSAEFRRNTWTEFSDQRLIGMPVILGAMFLLAFLFNGRLLDGHTGTVASYAFIVLIFIWGTRLAAESVVTEVNDRTWDLQRMSAISAWDMAWGKLFGATAFAWYGALICLGFYAVSYDIIMPFGTVLTAVSLYIGAGVLAHSICLILSLQAIQRRREFGRIQVVSYQFLGLLCAIPPLYAGLSGYGEDGQFSVTTWYGEPVALSHFMLAALSAFVFWALLGVYALIRIELQQKQGPWLWWGFVAFCMIFFAGLRYMPWGLPAFLTPLPGAATVALVIAILATYVIALGEPKQRVRFRRIGHYWHTREWGHVLQLAPRSVLTLPLVIAAAFVTGALTDVTRVQGATDVLTVRLAIVATVLFVIRDVGVIYVLSLGRSDGRGDSHAFLYLILLYTAIPALFSTLKLTPLLPFFWPQWGEGPMLAVLPPLLEVAIVIFYLRRRWRDMDVEE